MFNILIKHRPINLDCFSCTRAYTTAPIQHANKFIPDWWKKLPNHYRDQNRPLDIQPTLKSCAGFIDLYSKGVILPMWSDLNIIVSPDGVVNWQFADAISSAGSHDARQMGEFIESIDSSHLKLVSPWVFKCKEDILWHCSQPVWNNQAGKNFVAIPGIVEFKHQGTTNVNLFVRHNSQFIIPYMQAMYHFIPISERPVKIHNHQVTYEELNKLESPPVAMLRSYYKRKKTAEEKESKCPFGFGN